MILGIELLFGMLTLICCCRCISSNTQEILYSEHDDISVTEETKEEDIEVILITKDNMIELEQKYGSECCSICLCEYEDGDHISITNCSPVNHSFHANCLAEWLMTKSVCPMCNKSLHSTLLEDPPHPYHQDVETREYSDDGVLP